MRDQYHTDKISDTENCNLFDEAQRIVDSTVDDTNNDVTSLDLNLQIGLPCNHDENIDMITESNHYKSSNTTTNNNDSNNIPTVNLLEYSSQDVEMRSQDADEYSLKAGGYWIPTLKEIMTGATRHSCPVCGRFFSRYNNVKMHMWVHRDRNSSRNTRILNNTLISTENKLLASNNIDDINTNKCSSNISVIGNVNDTNRKTSRTSNYASISDYNDNYNVLMKLPCFCYAPGCRHHVSHPRPKPLRDLRTLQSHFLRKHENVRPFVCSKCGKGLAVRGDWRTHEKNCGKRWFCSCGSVFRHKRSLNEHVIARGPPHRHNQS